MPIAHIEANDGKWATYMVSHKERRRLIASHPPEHRFIESNGSGTVYLTYPHPEDKDE